MALLQSRGFRNVAAIGSANLSTARWDTLGRLGVRKATLVLDNDDAGHKGTEATVDNALRAADAPTVYVLDPSHLHPHKDPDELVREKGLGAFETLLERRQASAVYRGLSFLEGVTPKSLDHQKRDAVQKVAGYIQRSLHGPWAAVDTQEIMRATSERTGWEPESLTPIFDEAERCGRLEAESREIPPGKQSGWNAVDSLEVSFNAGELAIVGARTGHCKTTFLVGLMLNWLRQETDEMLIFYSAEEPEVRIFHRLLSVLSVDGSSAGEGWTANQIRDFLRDPNFRGAKYRWPDWGYLDAAKADLRQLEDRLAVVHRPAWDAEETAAHARGLAGRRPVGAVLVDYLQRIPVGSGRFSRRDQEVSAVGRRLKTLAEEIAAPVVAAAQINRDAIPKDFKKQVAKAANFDGAVKAIRTARPDLNHLREGGSEQEADVVLGLLNYAADYRTDADAADEVPAVTLFEVGSLKNRYGPVGRWSELEFEARYGLLKDPPRYE